MRCLKMLVLAAVAALTLMALIGAGTASANAPMKICSPSGAGEACGGTHGKHYTGELHTYLGTKNTTWTSSFTTVACDSTFSAHVRNATIGTIGITALTFASCTSAQASNCSASSTASAANPWESHVRQDTAVGATETDATLLVTAPTLQFKCTVLGIPQTCIYSAAEAGQAGEITSSGGTTPTIKAEKVAFNKEAGSSGGCSATIIWSGTYQVTTPHEILFTKA